MTPFATSCYAMVQNIWTNTSFKHPMLFGVGMIIISNILYVYAYHEKNFTYLLFSRFIFGFGGSKVVHRKYIANYILKQHWTRYYQRLIFVSFLGMSFGPLVYLAMTYINIDYQFAEKAFLFPGYMGLSIFTGFFLIILLFFRRFNIEKKPRKEESRPYLSKNYGVNTTSNYSLDSSNDEEQQKMLQQQEREQEEVELQHYNERLREISKIKGFWSKYGSYIILLVLRFMQKVTQDALIVILPVLIAITTDSNLPLRLD